MDSNTSKIGEVTVEVKAGLSVDTNTFRTCLDLIAIHGKNEGLRGMIVRFPSDDDFGGCSTIPIFSEEGFMAAIDGLGSVGDKKGEEK